MRKAAIITERPDLFDYVFASGRRELLARTVSLHPVLLNSRNLASEAPKLKDVELVFSTWGMPSLAPEQIDLLPALKAVFYAAGSVKAFAGPFLDKGIAVVSAWRANGIPVAEFVCAQILLSCKGYFRNTREARDSTMLLERKCHVGRGVFGEKVGLVGCGVIARHLIGMLKPFQLKILVYDPYLSDAEAASLGVERVQELDQIFSKCYVVSNHLPNLEALRGALCKSYFSMMREGATFINTGRGAQIDEPGLIDVLSKRPDLTALLDVTDPEPPPADSPFYKMQNVRISSHIAGAMNDEVLRLADLALEEFKRWDANLPLEHAVSKEMLARMA